MNDQSLPPTADIEEEVERLGGSLVQGDYCSAMRSYRTLYRMGPVVIPVVREVALRANWSTKMDHLVTRYISGLVSLVHDLDERESRELVEELHDRGCGPVVYRALRNLTRTTMADYRETTARGTKIMLHRDLPSKWKVEARITRWLQNVPEQDLENIEAIFIAPSGLETYEGDYMPFLCSIRVFWQRELPVDWLRALVAEHTLYHEIGHHVHRHTFGEDREQEKAANRYAGLCMRRTHSRFVLRALRGLFES